MFAKIPGVYKDISVVEAMFLIAMDCMRLLCKNFNSTLCILIYIFTC